MSNSSTSSSATSIASAVQSRTFANGLTVLVQPMPWLRTAAFSLSLPAGVENEPDDRPGLASLVCEMVQRGAGRYSSRELVAIQDELGIDGSSGTSSRMVSFGAAMPAESLPTAIGLYADVVRRPHLPADQLDDARLMAVQELRAIEDEPVSRVMRRLRELHYGDRLGRSATGTMESLESITQDDVRGLFAERYHATDSVLAVAGNVIPEAVFQLAEETLGDWRSGDVVPPVPATGGPATEHMESSSSQTHIGFSFDSIPYGHEDYFVMRAGIGILSDGMSSRLFDRVREQRGLCYTVSASCNSLKQAAGVFGYAGTTPARAQETLDVTLHEIHHLIDDLDPHELERWKVRIQSSLIMEQESSSSRASSMANDWLQLGRVMTLDELETAIESITLDQVQQYYRIHRPKNFRLVTSGPHELKINS